MWLSGQVPVYQAPGPPPPRGLTLVLSRGGEKCVEKIFFFLITFSRWDKGGSKLLYSHILLGLEETRGGGVD